MAIPDLRQPKLIESRSRQTNGQDYTTYTRGYDMGRLSLSDSNLEPGDGLPEDSTIIITDSWIELIRGEGSRIAVVIAKKALYSVSSVSGSATQTGTTMTLTSGTSFYAGLVGQTINIPAGTPTSTVVVTYTNTTTITVADSQELGLTTPITYPPITLELARTRQYRGTKTAYWSAIKRFHSLPVDTATAVFGLWSSSFTFNANFPLAYAYHIDVVPKDPNVPTYSLITVEYRTSYNPKVYPINVATQEMLTTSDTKKLLYDLTTPTALPIDTEPDDDGVYNAVKTGTNIVPDARALFAIRTAILRASLDYLDLAQFLNKGNVAAFSKIGGGIPIRQALCLKVGVAPDYIDDGSDAYVPVQFLFGYYDFDLNGYCTSGRRRRISKSIPLLDYTDNPDSDTRTYLKIDGTTTATITDAAKKTVMNDEWFPGASETTARIAIKFADFSSIDALVTWGP